jgi:hypothetical protein
MRALRVNFSCMAFSEVRYPRELLLRWVLRSTACTSVNGMQDRRKGSRISLIIVELAS